MYHTSSVCVYRSGPKGDTGPEGPAGRYGVDGERGKNILSKNLSWKVVGEMTDWSIAQW